MPFLIEPCDELAPQVVQTLLKIQQDQGPSTLVSPRGEVTAAGEVVHSVSTADRAEVVYEAGYVPVWQWLEAFFCDH